MSLRFLLQGASKGFMRDLWVSQPLPEAYYWWYWGWDSSGLESKNLCCGIRNLITYIYYK